MELQQEGDEMNGWEFLKYLVDTAYNHWCITALFICLILKIQLLNISGGEEEKQKLNIDYPGGNGIYRPTPPKNEKRKE